MYYLKKKKNTSEKKPRTKKKREEKSTSELVKELDRVFSKYIRLRDVMPNRYFVCISCGKIKPFEQGDCGHFYSRTHMGTRFDEDNCHCECRGCNRFSADHLIGYQLNLQRKIGESRFQALVWKMREPKHWTRYELIEMIKHYKTEVLRLSSEKGIKIT